MISLSIEVQVKQMVWSKMLFKIVLFMDWGLISAEKSLSVINKSLKYGSFKYRVNKGPWLTVDTSETKLEL